MFEYFVAAKKIEVHFDARCHFGKVPQSPIAKIWQNLVPPEFAEFVEVRIEGVPT